MGVQLFGAHLLGAQVGAQVVDAGASGAQAVGA
jgi:hypothetical protein